MAAERQHCDEPGCDDNGGEGFANGGALRIHRIAKHGAAAGTCEWCGRPFVNLPAHQRKCKAAPSATGAVMDEPGPDLGMGDGPGPSIAAESAPQVGPVPPADPAGTNGKTGMRDKLRTRFWGNREQPGTSGPVAPDLYGAKEKAPRVKTGPRKSAANLLALVWGGLGTALVKTGADVPVGRTLQFQSDAAGEVLDRLFAKTMVDRFILQPIASREDEAEAFGALLGAPILVGLYERAGAEGAAFYEPLLRQVIAANINAMGPPMQRRKAEEKKFAKTCEDLVAAGILPPMAPGPNGQPPDYAGAVLDVIFSPPPGAAPPPPPMTDDDNTARSAAPT